MAKGYNQKNKLLRIQDIQNVFNEEYKQGMVIEWVFKNKIKDRFRIGRNAFYKALKVNVKKELELLEQQLDEKENKNKFKQSLLDFPE